MKKKLILANNRSRLVSLRNLRKRWSTFLHQVYPEGNCPIIREHILREMPLHKWLSFFIYFGQKRSFLCCCNFTLCVYFTQNFILGRICKVAIFKNILTKLILKIEEISIASWRIALFFKQKFTYSENSLRVGSLYVAWSVEYLF